MPWRSHRGSKGLRALVCAVGLHRPHLDLDPEPRDQHRLDRGADRKRTRDGRHVDGVEPRPVGEVAQIDVDLEDVAETAAGDFELPAAVVEGRRGLRLDGPAMAYCIRRCCELKADVVAADERETGLRALLNLGHTFGHAIEAEMGYGNWLHGEAVAAGMVMAARASERLGQFSRDDTQRIITLLTRAGLPVNGPQEMSAEAYIPHMLRDKKVLAGEMRLVLPLAIGKSEVRGGVPHDVVLGAIADCQQA